MVTRLGFVINDLDSRSSAKTDRERVRLGVHWWSSRRPSILWSPCGGPNKGHPFVIFFGVCQQPILQALRHCWGWSLEAALHAACDNIAATRRRFRQIPSDFVASTDPAATFRHGRESGPLQYFCIRRVQRETLRWVQIDPIIDPGPANDLSWNIWMFQGAHGRDIEAQILRWNPHPSGMSKNRYGGFQWNTSPAWFSSVVAVSCCFPLPYCTVTVAPFWIEGCSQRTAVVEKKRLGWCFHHDDFWT
jgi:hypothetical protein